MTRSRDRGARAALVALCATTLGAGAARAGSVVEVQIAAQPLTAAMAAAAQSKELCLAEFPCPLGGGQCLVDRLEFGANPSLRRSAAATAVPVGGDVTVQTTTVQAVLPFKAFVKTVACAEDPACPAAQAAALPLAAVLDLSLQGGQLCASLAGIEPGGVVPPSVAGALAGAFGTVCRDVLPVDALAPLLGAGHTVTGEGMSVDPSLTRLGFRFEFDGTSAATSGAAWQSFLAGTLGASVSGKDWSLLVDEKLLRAVVAARIKKAIADDPDVALDGGIGTSWSPAAARVDAKFAVTVDIACPNDIGASVSAGAAFSLGPGGTSLVTKASVSTSPDAGDVALCVGLFTLFGGVGPGATTVTAVSAAILAATAGGDVPQGCSGTSDSHTCSQGFTLPAPLLPPDVLLGLAPGLLLAGPVTPGVVPPPPAPAVITAGSIGYGLSGGCNSLTVGFKGSVGVAGAGRFCGAKELGGDPLGAFSLSAPAANAPLPVTIGVDFQPSDAYWAAPYGTAVAVRTSRGARAVAIPPVVQPTQAAVMEAQNQMILADLACLKPKLTLTDFIPNWEDPDWGTVVARVTTPDGRVLRARVTLGNVAFRAGRALELEAAPGTRAGLGVQEMELVATAVVTADRLRFSVPVAVPLEMALEGRVDADGRAALSLQQPTGAAVTLRGGALPAAVAGVSFDVGIAAGAVTLRAR